MILYLDTSSLLKRYLRDNESSAIDAKMAGADASATSKISLAEAAAVLQATPPWARATRSGLLSALEALTADWDDYIVIDVDERLAADLAWRRKLKGFGALHVAAALTAAALVSPDPLVFASFDRDLEWVARAEGLHTVDWAG